MLKIEFIEEGGSKRLVINGLIDKNSECHIVNSKMEIDRLSNDKVIKNLLDNTINEIGETITFISINKNFLKNWELGSSIGISIKDVRGVFILSLELKPQNWNRPFTISQFVESLESYHSLLFEVDIDIDDYWDISFTFILDDDKAILNDEIIRGVEIIEMLITEVEQTLQNDLEKDPITSYFTFPEEIKAACKQYLVYFAQFLMDLGIEADTEIKEVAHQTLFKVIPKNKEESLDKIREALDVYLNIPKDFDIQVAQNNDVAVLQWQANIKHWESQVLIAKAAIQLKDATINSQIATIESLKLSNYQYREILEQKNLESEAKNEVEIAGGLVKVKEYDGDGFSINLPEILRRLKRIFK